MVALSRIRACVCVGVTLAVAASCAQPVQGYRNDPGACSVLSDASIVEQLGPEAVAKPNPPDGGGADDGQWSRCEWESFHPPRWGDFGNASIEVTVQISTTEDGEPDVETGRMSYQGTALPGEIPDAPPDVIGDASRTKFHPSDGGSQSVKIDILRANAHITVEYLGWGDRDYTRYYLPRELQEQPTRDMAREVLNQLGEPT